MKPNNFNDIREVMSPSSTHSSNRNNEIRESFVVTKNLGFGGEPSLLDFKSSKIESKFANISMIQSQVMNNSSSSAFSSSTVTDRFGPTSNSNRSIDPMKESTMNYVRNAYRAFGNNLGNLPEDRLKYISENFLRLYGTDREITENGLKNIQREAHSNQSFEQTPETIKSLFSVLDANKDKRITQEDILLLARRYLSFEKKAIIYTPMVEERLNVARRLFKQFDVERKGYLTEKQVPNLLTETYKCLGKTFTATKEDVRSWMKLTDGDGDDRVTLPEYEKSIIRALKKQGVRIYENEMF